MASQVIEQAKTGIFDISREASDLLRQANEAANAGDLNKAITLLRKAIPLAWEKGQEALKKQLAQVLNARGVQSINSAMPSINRAMEDLQPKINADVEAFLAGRYKEKDSAKSKSSGGHAWAIIIAAWVVLLAVGGLLQKYTNHKTAAQVILNMCWLAVFIPAISGGLQASGNGSAISSKA